MPGTALRYILPLLVLGAVVAAFVGVRRHRALGPRTQYWLAAVAAAPLVLSGTVHLVRPSAMVPLLPPWVPARTLVILATGLPEWAGAIGLFFAPTRRLSALWLALLMIAIFPANVYVAGQKVGALQMPGVPVRTVMQASYIVLLLVVGYGRPTLGGARD